MGEKKTSEEERTPGKLRQAVDPQSQIDLTLEGDIRLAPKRAYTPPPHTRDFRFTDKLPHNASDSTPKRRRRQDEVEGREATSARSRGFGEPIEPHSTYAPSTNQPDMIKIVLLDGLSGVTGDEGRRR